MIIVAWNFLEAVLTVAEEVFQALWLEWHYNDNKVLN